ncbi:hypothetical protein CISIN_1g024869mg [Citrus sinensis]|uniref:UDP-glycosyltransferases domain-containing protein n=1 Tax=Citrus sinensis TaxID=2711 RepID=A0A067F1D4_CITSI|nr:hypothetical protein CISIN_1g024869mg [Citrus sinensis]
MDRLIQSVPGMENFLRCRDLPSICRAKNPMDLNLQLLVSETRTSARTDGLILNTFEDLEGPILSQIRAHCPKIYTIGPLNAQLKARIPENTHSPNSLWGVDKSCIAWLENQPSQSVICISFGSVAVMSRDQLMEFWHGLVNSNKRFLWVIRPDLVSGKDDETQIPGELDKEEVLAHKAIGAFFTPSGWNSTLESIVAGVPMICWRYLVDQQVNSRFIVEKLANDLFEERWEEFTKSAGRMANLASISVNERGSSYCNLNHL